MTEYVDVSTIKPGDEVQVDYRHTETWYSVEGWHEVMSGEYGGASLYAAGWLIRIYDGEAAEHARVRAHRPAPEPIPAEVGAWFRATVRGDPNHLVFRIDNLHTPFVTEAMTAGGWRFHRAEDITDVRDVRLPEVPRG